MSFAEQLNQMSSSPGDGLMEQLAETRAAIVSGEYREQEERPDVEALPERFRALEDQLLEALRMKEELDARIETLKQELLIAMQEADAKSWKSERATITRQLMGSRVSFDSKRFKEEHEDIYNAYLKETSTKSNIRVTINKNYEVPIK